MYATVTLFELLVMNLNRCLCLLSYTSDIHVQILISDYDNMIATSSLLLVAKYKENTKAKQNREAVGVWP